MNSHKLATPLLFLMVLGCSSSSSNRLPASQVSTVFHVCSDYFKTFFRTSTASEYSDFKQTLMSLEALSAREHFSPLDGIAGLSEKSLSWKRAVKRSLKKLSRGETISEAELKKIVYHLYKMSHPQSVWKKLGSRIMYLENAETLLLRRVNEELARRNIFEALSELGFLRENNALENFKLKISQEQNKIRSIFSLALNTMIVQSGQPFIMVPNLQRMRQIDLPDDLMERIFNQGVDSVYGDIKTLLGSRANFDVIWQRFRYGVNGLVMLYVMYTLPDQMEKMNEELQKAAMDTFSKSIESISAHDDESELEETLNRHLKEYSDFMYSTKGRYPTPQEVEEAKVLYYYFSGSMSL